MKSPRPPPFFRAGSFGSGMRPSVLARRARNPSLSRDRSGTRQVRCWLLGGTALGAVVVRVEGVT